MSKLLKHFKKMQAQVQQYLPPEDYTDLEGKVVVASDREGIDSLFIGDMIYMLDGPEQREAQAEAEFDYIKEALRTESVKTVLSADWNNSRGEWSMKNRLLHAAMGMATEAGEFLDALKKHLFYGKPLDTTNLKEEIGDQLWYLAIACDALGTDFETEMKRNIAKLRTRYPDKFTSENAIDRNVTSERFTLERS